MKIEAKSGIELIADERTRQIKVEGYTAEHDAKDTYKALSLAAISYTQTAIGNGNQGVVMWPWDYKYYKPTFGVRDLVRAGALIAAAIDRLQAEELKKEPGK